jgi:penicillin-binding protein 1A
LPAQTWHDIMTYAHQGIELKQIPGLSAPTGPQGKVADANTGIVDTVPRAPTLTKRGIDVLVQMERLMDDATRALAERSPAGQRADAPNPPPGQSAGAVASASDGQPAPIRGN